MPPIPYHSSCTKYCPNLDDIEDTFNNLRRYGLCEKVVDDRTGIAQALMDRAEQDPIRVYALAASQGLESVTVASSQLTLQTMFSEITEKNATLMGPIYLRRLFFLHAGLGEALKRIIRQVEAVHLSDPNCCTQETKRVLERRWQYAVGTLLLEPKVQAVTPQALASLLGSVRMAVPCAACRRVVEQRAVQAAASWAAVRKTI